MKAFTNGTLLSFFLMINYLFGQDWQWFNAVQTKGSNGAIVFQSVTNKIISSDNDSTIFVSGNNIDTTIYLNDTLFVKKSRIVGYCIGLNPSGNILWKYAMFGDKFQLSDISLHNDTLYLFGTYGSKMYYNNGNDSISSSYPNTLFIVRLYKNGNFIDIHTIANSFNASSESITVSDALYLTGHFSEIIYFNNDTIALPYTDTNLFVVKLNTNFDVVWKQYGNKYYKNNFVYSHIGTMQNNLYITGHFQNNFQLGSNSLAAYGINGFVLQINTQNGNINWLKKLGDVNTRGTYYTDLDIHQKNILLSGFVTQPSFFNTTNLYPSPACKAVLIRLDTIGDIKKVWTNTLGKDTKCLSSSFDKSGNIYTQILFQDSIQFLNHSLFLSDTNAIQHIGIFKISNDTNIRYIHTISSKEISITNTTTDSKGNLYCTGNFLAKKCSADTFQLTVNGSNINYSGYVSKISCHFPSAGILANDTSICHNQTAILTTSYNPFYQPHWNTGSNNYTITVSGGTYSLFLTDENNCTSDTNSITITQFPRTHAVISQICDSILAQPAFSNPYWIFNGQIINTTYTATAQQNGWYTFHATDTNNCLIQDSIYINIQPVLLTIEKLCDSLKSNINNALWYWNGQFLDTAHTIYIQGDGWYYTLYKDSIGCIWTSDSIPIEIARLNASSPSVYPNPASNNLFIRLPDNINIVTINLTSLQGKTIQNLPFEKTLNDNPPSQEHCHEQNSSYQIQLPPSLPPSLYILQIQTNLQTFYHKISTK